MSNYIGYRDNTGVYMNVEEFLKYKENFECKNLKKLQAKNMGMWNWSKMPDIINHYERIGRDLVKVPLGILGNWGDRFEKKEYHVGCDLIGPLNELIVSETLPPDEIDMELREAQLKLVEELTSKTIGLGHCSTGTGKAQPLYSNILGENGWIKMGDIKEGDKIFGDDGKICNVIGVFPQGKHDIYEVVFNDGTKAQSCLEHLWTVQDSNNRDRVNYKRVGGNKYNNRTKPLYQTIDLGTIKDNLLKFKGLSNERLNYSIDINKPIEFNNRELLIHPYLLGLFLGDGNSTQGNTVSISDSELDIIEKIKSHISDNDYITQQIDNRSNSIDNNILNRSRGTISDFSKSLTTLGLTGKYSYEKFIPDEYLYSSIDDRVELLRGLIDTDGYVMKGRGHSSCIEYSTTSEQLKDDIIFLVRSLGGFVSTIKRKSSYVDKLGARIGCKDNYRIHITMPSDIVPVSSKKHLDRFSPSTKYFRKYIKEVNIVGQEECQCIMVDNESHLYITDDFTCTHNTYMLAKIIEKYQVKTLIVCSGIELMNQMSKDIHEFFSMKPVTIYGTKKKQKDSDSRIVIGNIDSLIKLPQEELEQFGLILLDEVDRYLQAENRLKWISTLCPERLYGFTGTIKLNHISDEVFKIYLGPKSELLQKNFTPDIYKVLTDFQYSEGELDDLKEFHKLKNELYFDEVRNEKIISVIKDTLKEQKGIVFCEYVEHAKLIKDKLDDEGFKTFMLIGEVKSDERKRIKQELKDFKGPCILIGSVKIIGRGFDVKDLSVAYLTTCEKFKSNIGQYIGRILRKAKGKTECSFYDITDTSPSILANQSKSRTTTYKREFPGVKITLI